MTIKTAREKAIKGGYNESKRLTALGVMKGVHEMLLDIEFWKCLSKEEGWGLWITDDKTGRSIETWVVLQHRLVDFIQERKDIEKSFDLATK